MNILLEVAIAQEVTSRIAENIGKLTPQENCRVYTLQHLVHVLLNCMMIQQPQVFKCLLEVGLGMALQRLQLVN